MRQQSATLPPSAFIDLNVLPENLRPRRDPVWYVLGVTALVLASAALIPLFRAEGALEEETARAQAELAPLEGALAQAQSDFLAARGLRQELAQAETEIAALNEERRAVLGDGRKVSADLSGALRLLPAGAGLASLASDENGLSLSGRAASAFDVLAYARSLSASERFSGATVASLAVGAEEDGVAFTIEVTR